MFGHLLLILLLFVTGHPLLLELVLSLKLEVLLERIDLSIDILLFFDWRKVDAAQRIHFLLGFQLQIEVFLKLRLSTVLLGHEVSG